MSLSKQRRNEIAYEYIVIRVSDLKVGFFFGWLRELCKKTGISDYYTEVLKYDILGSVDSYSTQSTYPPPEKDYCEMAWRLVVHENQISVETGINSPRDLSNNGCADKLKVEARELKEFSTLIFEAVDKLTKQRQA